jgi:hypothetical protein
MRRLVMKKNNVERSFYNRCWSSHGGNRVVIKCVIKLSEEYLQLNNIVVNFTTSINESININVKLIIYGINCLKVNVFMQFL